MNKEIIKVVFWICIIFFLLYALIDYIPFGAVSFVRCDTAVEALKKSRSANADKILGVLEDNGAALIVFTEKTAFLNNLGIKSNTAVETSINNTTIFLKDIVVKDEKGWIPPNRKFYKEICTGTTKGYSSFSVDKINNKYVIVITSLNDTEISVSDSIGSKFKHLNKVFKYQNEVSWLAKLIKPDIKPEEVEVPINNWFLALDELPENYKLIINGEEIAIN